MLRRIQTLVMLGGTLAVATPGLAFDPGPSPALCAQPFTVDDARIGGLGGHWTDHEIDTIARSGATTR